MIFDLEAVFVVSWAISLRQVGWAGYVGVLIFILILVAVLIYEWRIGALDFGPNSKKILKAYYRRLQKKQEHELVDRKSEQPFVGQFPLR